MDTALIRRTYRTMLGESRVGRPDLGSQEQHAHLAGLLRGHLKLLLTALEGQAAVMSPETRRTAGLVVRRTGEALCLSIRTVRHPDHLHDLASLSRALLTLLDCAHGAVRNSPLGHRASEARH
ncbi:hypothetical protein [Streptomyces sp. NPDC093094]|uniref:hypothetical protein n=1 Tax=Streptomyces sp. NPDC093094 TaxID=3366026 RepID=UPI00380BD178